VKISRSRFLSGAVTSYTVDRTFRRAQIVLLAADDAPVKDIVNRVEVSKPTVIGWKKRYAAPPG